MEGRKAEVQGPPVETLEFGISKLPTHHATRGPPSPKGGIGSTPDALAGPISIFSRSTGLWSVNIKESGPFGLTPRAIARIRPPTARTGRPVRVLILSRYRSSRL